MLAVLAKHSPIHAGMNKVQQVVLVELAVEPVVHHQEEGDGKLVARRRMIKMRTGIGGKWNSRIQFIVCTVECSMAAGVSLTTPC